MLVDLLQAHWLGVKLAVTLVLLRLNEQRSTVTFCPRMTVVMLEHLADWLEHVGAGLPPVDWLLPAG